MATTYLHAVNEILQELNEVELTSSNFASAVGIHQFVKSIINRAYRDIVNAEKEWPFLSAGTNDEPFLGSEYVESVAGQRWYLLKTGATDTRDDYSSVDWDSFYLTDFGVAGATEPYENRNLPFSSIDQWIKYHRENDNDAHLTTGSESGVPQRVMVSADGRSFGLSPIPDAVYRIYFSAWNQPTELTAYSSEFVFADRWMPVLYARARYYMWQFKESPQQAAFALNEYKEGLSFMRNTLIDPTPDNMLDDRARFI